MTWGEPRPALSGPEQTLKGHAVRDRGTRGSCLSLILGVARPPPSSLHHNPARMGALETVTAIAGAYVVTPRPLPGRIRGLTTG